jgi:deoxyribodipyrimidine photo-lyase
MRALIWFRADLRLRDNPALYHACRNAARGVVGVFTICPSQWRGHDWADCRVEFLRRNLIELSRDLSGLNIPLRILHCDDFALVPQALLDLARAQECDAIYFNCEYEFNERRRDERVTELFKRAGIKTYTFDDQAILPPGSVLSQQETPYTVFTPFHRAWLTAFLDRDESRPLPRPRAQASLVCLPDSIPPAITGFNPEQGRSDLWPAGEAAAHKRLKTFLKVRIHEYHDKRDLPGVNGTSLLSPYLTSGVVSARTCLAGAMAAGAFDSGSTPKAKKTSTWITELIWRDFYKHLLVAFPRLSMGRAFRQETEDIPWRTDADDFEAWCRGRTGYPIVDAAMRQLTQTAWMHNRLRMITAMFLTKQLLIDWRKGEQFFMRHLIDGDLASNNGGWQWSASTGTDAAPYFRIFNPSSQSRRFDPEGVFIRRFLPELEDVPTLALHDPARLTECRPSGYPPPICDHAKARKRAIDAFTQLGKR